MIEGGPSNLLINKKTAISIRVYEPSGREFESLRARHPLLTGHMVRIGGSAAGSDLPIRESTETPVHIAAQSAVGCEIVFMPQLATDIIHCSAFSSDSRRGERVYVPFYRFVHQVVRRRALDEHGPGCNIP